MLFDLSDESENIELMFKFRIHARFQFCSALVFAFGFSRVSYLFFLKRRRTQIDSIPSFSLFQSKKNCPKLFRYARQMVDLCILKML